jgi:type I restriction enzyme S subunit
MSELPRGWVPAKLNQIAIPDRPRELPQDHPDMPFIGMENIEAQTMRLLGTVPASELKSSAVHFQTGDVLYGRLRPYLNKVHVAQVEGLCSAEFIVFSKRKELNPSWLAYLLNSTDFVSFASHLNTGDRPRVDFDQIGEFNFMLAPRREQDRIVDEIEKQVSRLDAATTALMRVQANLKRYRASVLKAACEGRLVPTEAELARKEGREYEPANKLLDRILRERRARWEANTLAKMIASGKSPSDDRWKQKYKEPSPPDSAGLVLPEGWVWATLEAVADVIDPNPSHRMPNYVQSDGIPFISSENFVGSSEIDFTIGKQVSADTMAQQTIRFSINSGAFALSRIGTIGKTRKLPIERNYCLSHALVVIQSTTPEIDNDFLRVVCSSSAMTALAHSGVQSVGVPDLGMRKIRTLPVPIVLPSEQARIVAEVDRQLSILDEYSPVVDRGLKRASGLRQAILQQAFAGKLVRQNPGDEPASVLLDRIHHERTLDMTEKIRPNSTRGRQMHMAPKQNRPKKSIIAVLSEAKTPLSPEELFRSTDHEPETVDEYYAELKAAVDAGQIEEIRPENGGILLRIGES